jgi:hypothetical protein
VATRHRVLMAARAVAPAEAAAPILQEAMRVRPWSYALVIAESPCFSKRHQGGIQNGADMRISI